jgi:hypothetical protein
MIELHCFGPRVDRARHRPEHGGGQAERDDREHERADTEKLHGTLPVR